jgi:hypothetical protein
MSLSRLTFLEAVHADYQGPPRLPCTGGLRKITREPDFPESVYSPAMRRGTGAALAHVPWQWRSGPATGSVR